MSRRRGEFEHRTSIFEGAFRAWSHLGGLAPEDVESKQTSDLDPLACPIENDPRLSSSKGGGDKEAKNPDGTVRREYPYEPLPRSGLAHPYVQAILSPWLGPDADNEAIQLGLTTLRTWWQHRRKGESGSAIAALGTEKMKGVVEGYTRHFFTLAHCLVVNDKEQPPRTLHGRMKELEKTRNKRNKKNKNKDDLESLKGSMNSSINSTDMVSDIKGDLTDTNMSPLERLHRAQQHHLKNTGMVHPGMPQSSQQLDISQQQPPQQQNQQQFPAPIVDMKGKCVPGKLDLPGVVSKVSRAAAQLAHGGGGGGGGSGGGGNVVPVVAPSGGPAGAQPPHQPMSAATQNFGDPNTTPVVFVSSRGDIMIAMEIDGITCAHCVKIVETVLKGCTGNKSPIEGLLDAAADQKLNAVLIKIDQASSAKRVAFEAARNLSMVGYTARVKEMSIVGAGADKKSTMDLGSLSTAFEVVASTDPKDFFDWRVPCTCPDNGVLRTDCSRHGQMNTRIFEAFDARQKQVVDYMAGCGMKYGMPCTCGPDCRCKNCPTHGNGAKGGSSINRGAGEQLDSNEEAQILKTVAQMGGPRPAMQGMQQPNPAPNPVANPFSMDDEDQPLQIEQNMDFFGDEPPKPGVGMGGVPVAAAMQPPQQQLQVQPPQQQLHDGLDPLQHNPMMDEIGEISPRRQSQRNPSIISYGGLRHMSMNSNSETTFGRAMSGLSALSIDWENLEDFDLEVDHSAHINNNGGGPNKGGGGGGDPRRSSLRRPQHAAMAPALPNQDTDAHVSFKV